MFFENNFLLPARHGAFTEYFRCFSASFLPGRERESINFGSKIILPPSALAKLTSLHIDYPMVFQLTSERSKKSTHGGVLEFIAEEGRVYVPRWMMGSLDLQEGELIKISNISLPQGKFVRIQPQSVDFLNISDPKAVLERAFRNYSTLTEGDIISISYNDKQYDILLMETKPSNAISILETDLEVDFAPPVGYVEPTRASPRSLNNTSFRDDMLKHVVSPTEDAKWTSSSLGHRLGGHKSDQKQSQNLPKAEAIDMTKLGSTPLPLRLPLGQLFFGYDSPTLDSVSNSAEGDSNPFKGNGQTLRSKKGKAKAT